MQKGERVNCFCRDCSSFEEPVTRAGAARKHFVMHVSSLSPASGDPGAAQGSSIKLIMKWQIAALDAQKPPTSARGQEAVKGLVPGEGLPQEPFLGAECRRADWSLKELQRPQAAPWFPGGQATRPSPATPLQLGVPSSPSPTILNISDPR